MNLLQKLSSDLTGKLIIAPPSVKNTFWHKTVAIITEHDKKGSVGLILNKPSKVSLIDLGKHLDLDLDIPGYAYIGGPVNSQVLSVIHTSEWECLNTISINEQFSVTSSNLMLSRFMDGDLPHKWRIVAGMCGWKPKQLLNEISGIYPYNHRDSWCIASCTQDLLFDYDECDQWDMAIEQSGLDFAKNLL